MAPYDAVVNEAGSTAADAGTSLHDFAAELYPFPRSLTGDGVRRTLAAIGRRIPLEVHDVPSGTPAFDWTVPREWLVREAHVTAPTGERVVDVAESNLHLVGYSVPVRARMTLEELDAHLHSLPDRPTWVPYRTSYWGAAWGFCLADDVRRALAPGQYDVVVDTELFDGSLTYGECFLPGTTDDEVLFSVHVCHPSLANDNLSGIAVATAVAEHLGARPHRYGYRFLFVPATVGSITWLSRNVDVAARVRAGLVLANLGDGGAFTYKRSRGGDAVVDDAVAAVLASRGDHAVRAFTPYGYDERQYCSPGFDLPVGCLMRTPHGEYPEYHTSADDLSFITGEALAEALDTVLDVVDVLERDAVYVNTSPFGEPQLGRRGLYRALGGEPDARERELALLWVLNQSDGRPSLLDVARRSGMPFRAIADAADALLEVGLLERVDVTGRA